MNVVILKMFFLLWIQNPTSPLGVWEYKQDKTKVEIENRNKKHFGSIISSDNPNLETGMEIIKNLQLVNGKWKGEFYLYKSNQWVDADFEMNASILFLEYRYGFMTKKLQFYRVKN